MGTDSQVSLLLQSRSYQKVYLLLQLQHSQLGEGREFTLCQDKQRHGAGAWYAQGMMAGCSELVLLGVGAEGPCSPLVVRRQGCRAVELVPLAPGPRVWLRGTFVVPA